jgi:PucR family transcriptional regulator, purine catabolism regulatory protein
MTVRAALALAPVRRGRPEVVAGRDALGRSIRWVASGDVAWIARDLKGGELLLTTGLGIGRRAAEQRRYVDALCERHVAAVAIELGGVMQEPPRALVERAEKRGLPLIALHREVPFVEITEAIHGAIVNRQYALLRRGDAIHRRFTELVLEGQGIPEVMAALAAMISDPVVLENARGELLHHAVHGAATEAVLDAWEAHRRQRQRGRGSEIDALSLPLPTGDGAEAGRLTALAVDSPLDDFDRVAVERAVGVIALALLRARQEDELALRGRGEFLAELASGTVEPEVARHRAETLGFVHRRSTLLALAVAITRRPRLTDVAVWAPVARRLRHEIDGLGVPALLGDRPREGDLLILVGIGEPADRPWLAERLAAVVHAAVDQELGGGHVAAVAVASAVRGWEDAPRALRDAAETAAFAREAGGRSWHDASEPDVDRLLWVLRDNPDLRRFADRRLAPLLDHDARRKNKLLPTVDALCEQGWQKAAAARALLIPRQVLYHRIERIARVLDSDLDDPRTRLGLELALRVRRPGAGVGRPPVE